MIVLVLKGISTIFIVHLAFEDCIKIELKNPNFIMQREREQSKITGQGQNDRARGIKEMKNMKRVWNGNR